MAPGEGEAVVLVPVLEAEVVEWRGVGELEVGKVPVDDLAVARGEVDVARRVRVHLLQLRDQRLLLLRQPLILLRRQVQLARLRPDEQSEVLIYYSNEIDRMLGVLSPEGKLSRHISVLVVLELLVLLPQVLHLVPHGNALVEVGLQLLLQRDYLLPVLDLALLDVFLLIIDENYK